MSLPDLHASTSPASGPGLLAPFALVATPLARAITGLGDRLALAEDAEAAAWSVPSVCDTLLEEAADLANAVWADLGARAEATLALAGRSREPGAREAGLAALVLLMVLAAPPGEAALIRERLAHLAPHLEPRDDDPEVTPAGGRADDPGHTGQRCAASRPDALPAACDEPLRRLLYRLAQDPFAAASDQPFDTGFDPVDLVDSEDEWPIATGVSPTSVLAKEAGDGLCDDWLDWTAVASA